MISTKQSLFSQERRGENFEDLRFVKNRSIKKAQMTKFKSPSPKKARQIANDSMEMYTRNEQILNYPHTVS